MRRHKGKRKRSYVCGGKVRYKDHDEATAAMRNAGDRWGNTAQKLPQRSYECPRCGGYHLTSQPKGDS